VQLNIDIEDLHGVEFHKGIGCGSLILHFQGHEICMTLDERELQLLHERTGLALEELKE